MEVKNERGGEDNLLDNCDNGICQRSLSNKFNGRAVIMSKYSERADLELILKIAEYWAGKTGDPFYCALSKDIVKKLEVKND